MNETDNKNKLKALWVRDKNHAFITKKVREMKVDNPSFTTDDFISMLISSFNKNNE